MKVTDDVQKNRSYMLGVSCNVWQCRTMSLFVTSGATGQSSHYNTLINDAISKLKDLLMGIICGRVCGCISVCVGGRESTCVCWGERGGVCECYSVSG